MGKGYWDYTKWQDERDDWNHELWKMDQKIKNESKNESEKGELKQGEFYEIALANGLTQLSIFPQVPKASVKSPKKAEEQTSSQEKIEDEDENDIQ